jgi:hypothetical protein
MDTLHWKDEQAEIHKLGSGRTAELEPTQLSAVAGAVRGVPADHAMHDRRGNSRCDVRALGSRCSG